MVGRLGLGLLLLALAGCEGDGVAVDVVAPEGWVDASPVLPDTGSDVRSAEALDAVPAEAPDEPPAEGLDAVPAEALDAPTAEAEPPADAAPGELPFDAGLPVAPVLSLTVDDVPSSMNGSTPFLDDDGALKDFHLAVPRRGFTLDVRIEPGSAPVAPESLRVTVDGVVGDLPAGTDLGPRFTWHEAGRARWQVDLDVEAGWPRTVRASVADAGGLWSDEASLAVDVRELTADLDPFDTEDLWLLDFRRDSWRVEVVDSATGFDVLSTPEPLGNGVADFDEALLALGLLGPDAGFNAAFLDRFRAEYRANLHTLFLLGPDGAPTADGVRVRFVFDGEPGAPDPADFSADGAFSMMAIGGDLLTPDGTPSGYLGMAWIDRNNRWRDDNTVEGHGVFFTALMRKTASLAGLKPLLASIVPGVGLPLGAREGDALLLDPAYSPPNDADAEHKKRHNLARLFFKVGGLGLAALTAHEMGHSLGLVAPGPPPAGLFGGASAASFAVGPSDDWHLDLAGANLMQSGKSLNVSDFLTSFPRFEPLSLAYLQRRLVVGAVDPVF